MKTELLKLYAKDIIDPVTESHYAFVSTIENTTGCHCHDFYEIFLVTNGSVIHLVNGKEQNLVKGALVFIRPNDIHYYQKSSSQDYQFINLAFPGKAIDSLFAYIDDHELYNRLMTPDTSPCTVLSEPEVKHARAKLENLNTISFSNRQKTKTELRIILLEFLTRYFAGNFENKNPEIPEWLNTLLYQMNQKENIVLGLPRMQELSGKTKEHLCRVLMKYCSKTPTDYVNELRINYAANMLLSTDQTIIDVSEECGFENLSYFYEIFKKHFGTTPSKFRKAFKRGNIQMF